MNFDWLASPPHPLDGAARAAATARQAQLTKPPGALGELESLAIRLAAMQAVECPVVDPVWIAVFAADHGVAEEGVSAFPQAVTAEMVKNFGRGGAAICVAAQSLAARLEVIDLGTVDDLSAVAGVAHLSIGRGTANFTVEPAMTGEQCARALDSGRHSAERARLANARLYIGGEMGIANTTSAAALACGLLNEAPENLAGPGTGLDPDGVAHKARVIRRALVLHGYLPSGVACDGAVQGKAAPQSGCGPGVGVSGEDAWDALTRLGGFEIAALVGAYLACAKMGMPVLVDGFISTAAALTAERICPGTANWLIYAHFSPEPGHARLLAELKAKPLLNLGLRLGEGSGAAVAVPILRMACALHSGMATFSEAGVSNPG
jgi:nicotinate-nucleotide--dimethylbenzimidazole phosphoribosyltransferase